MSGYPAAPGQRMPYDRDGSVMTAWWGGQYPLIYGTAMSSINAEQPVNYPSGLWSSGWYAGGGPVYVSTIFPELRDIAGLYIAAIFSVSFSDYLTYWTSTDTTTGMDGTWTQQTTKVSPGATGYNGSNPDAYRTDILSVSWPGVKAVQAQFSSFGYGYQLLTWHLYGQPSAGQNPDSLRVWQPTTNAEVTGPLDFGDVTQGSIYTQQFRIANISSTYTANGPITISAETLYDANPSLIPQYNFSTNGTSYSSSVTISSLAPGAVSSVLYVQGTISASAQLGPWALRILAIASSWT